MPESISVSIVLRFHHDWTNTNALILFSRLRCVTQIVNIKRKESILTYNKNKLFNDILMRN